MSFHCQCCGEELKWDSDCMQSEIGKIGGGVIDNDDEDSVVGLYQCTQCHLDYMIYSPTPAEMEYDPDLVYRIEIFNQSDE